MIEIRLRKKFFKLPSNIKLKIIDFIYFLKHGRRNQKNNYAKPLPGKAKGLISMKDNFDDSIEGFNPYIK